MTTDPKQLREFSSMDDHDNDGWNNSTIEREEKIHDPDDEQIEDEEDLDYSPNEDF